MDLTLKPETEKLVKEWVERGEYRDASALIDEAVQYLFEMDKAEAQLEVLVQEGIDSGPATDMTREDFEAIRREIRGRYARKGE